MVYGLRAQVPYADARRKRTVGALYGSWRNIGLDDWKRQHTYSTDKSSM